MIQEIEKVAQLSKEEAKQLLTNEILDETRRDVALQVRNIEQTAKDEATHEAKKIISLAIQRCASDHASEITVSVVPLPSDDMKARIIGREGRNIRALENATGIELIVDDTPEVVILSGFDPVRREIARITLEKLIADGRIHPARIEETVEKVKKELDQEIKASGESAMFEVGIFGLHPELIKLIGRLKYRTSYGQNVYKHSIEVAQLAGLMASELGLDVNLAKRAGLLHDIGKAVDHEQEGTHVQLGADLAKKYKESANVVNAIAAHHGDVEPKTIEAVLVAAADAISGARPGARRETGTNYVKRLEKLEEIASSFNGVDKSYAIQAGREVRVIVKPEQIDDAQAMFLAKDIAKKIEAELEYPGQIKVNVIRESRSVEYAK
jgi:ribonuclease Y